MTWRTDTGDELFAFRWDRVLAVMRISDHVDFNNPGLCELIIDNGHRMKMQMDAREASKIVASFVEPPRTRR